MKLYVGNLSFSTSAADVRTLFEQAGAVGSCELVSDKFTGQSRGFAFVEMESSSEGSQAIQRFNDFELDGRKMVVNEARPREARAGGFGGGGFGARREAAVPAAAVAPVAPGRRALSARSENPARAAGATPAARSGIARPAGNIAGDNGRGARAAGGRRRR